jgi:hypothetical protein
MAGARSFDLSRRSVPLHPGEKLEFIHAQVGLNIHGCLDGISNLATAVARKKVSRLGHI